MTAKTVYSAVEVTVTAAAKDGSGVTGTYSLTVYPAVSWVKIEQLNGDGTTRVMNGRTVPAAPGDVFRLQAACFPSEALQEQGAVWSSSNSRAASVDADGTVHVKAMGSVKITARAGGKSAAFTLKIG